MEIARCNLADERELRRVHALQRAAYAIEAEMIRCWTIPALLESPADLARSRETFWGCFRPSIGDEPRACVGIVATEPEPGAPGVLRIARLAVDPAHMGRGIGRRLVMHALAESRERGCGTIVSTGEANTPARRLYESVGFILHRTFTAPGGDVKLVEYRLGASPPGRPAAGEDGGPAPR